MAVESLKPVRAWDNQFYSWADELLIGRRSPKPKKSSSGGSVSSWTGLAVGARVSAGYSDQGSKADVAARLSGMANGRCQVMIKITGGAKNARSISQHFAYLSREGEVPLTDQDGRTVEGEEALKRLTQRWVQTGPKLPEHGERKETLQIVFSMPEGTDARALADAVRATAKAEFGNHQWAMVQHFDEPQVHAHIAVKTESLEGVRLNPRKADLQRWRERFAFELRERGVEAEATRRAPRLKREKVNKPWAVTRLEERQIETNPKPAVGNAERIAKSTDTEKRVTTLYFNLIEALRQSQEVEDRKLAAELAQMLIDRYGLKNPAERKPKPIDQEHKTISVVGDAGGTKLDGPHSRAVAFETLNEEDATKRYPELRVVYDIIRNFEAQGRKHGEVTDANAELFRLSLKTKMMTELFAGKLPKPLEAEISRLPRQAPDLDR
jgi:Relaxase/Mobilisation nuclease domain